MTASNAFEQFRYVVVLKETNPSARTVQIYPMDDEGGTRAMKFLQAVTHMDIPEKNACRIPTHRLTVCALDEQAYKNLFLKSTVDKKTLSNIVPELTKRLNMNLEVYQRVFKINEIAIRGDRGAIIDQRLIETFRKTLENSLKDPQNRGKKPLFADSRRPNSLGNNTLPQNQGIDLSAF